MSEYVEQLTKQESKKLSNDLKRLIDNQEPYKYSLFSAVSKVFSLYKTKPGFSYSIGLSKGINYNQMWRILNGKRRGPVSLELLEKLSSIFCVSTDNSTLAVAYVFCCSDGYDKEKAVRLFQGTAGKELIQEAHNLVTDFLESDDTVELKHAPERNFSLPNADTHINIELQVTVSSDFMQGLISGYVKFLAVILPDHDKNIVLAGYQSNEDYVDNIKEINVISDAGQHIQVAVNNKYMQRITNNVFVVSVEVVNNNKAGGQNEKE